MSNPFFLASGPVGILEQAIQVTLLHGGEYSAGDAQDKLNKDIFDPNNKDVGNWHAAWKGKTSQTYRILKRLHPTKRIDVVAIAGGPACDWERGELRNNFCQEYPDMFLKQIGDYDDYVAWLERTYPRGESEPVAEVVSQPAPAPAPHTSHPQRRRRVLSPCVSSRDMRESLRLILIKKREE